MSESLTTEQSQAMADNVQATLGWTAADFELEPLTEWEHPNITLIRAVPKVPGPGALFALLPDGYVVSQYDPNGLSRIVRHAFMPLKPEHARDLAWLATLFGQFPEGAGTLAEEDPGGRHDVPLPRPDFGVVYSKDASGPRIAFYAYNHDARRLYDCAVEIREGKVMLSSRWLGVPPTYDPLGEEASP